MLYVCVQTFDVTENRENFWELNMTIWQMLLPTEYVGSLWEKKLFFRWKVVMKNREYNHLERGNLFSMFRPWKRSIFSETKNDLMILL
jgi:hypothetical protein